jgi:hypothetical protein
MDMSGTGASYFTIPFSKQAAWIYGRGKCHLLLSLAMSAHFVAKATFTARVLCTSIDVSISIILQARLDILKRTEWGRAHGRKVSQQTH